jgi:hypothetical protein
MFVITNPKSRALPACYTKHPVLSQCSYTLWSATPDTGRIIRTVAAPGAASVSKTITTVKIPELARQVAGCMQQLTANPALNLAPLAVAAAGKALDIPRLVRHVAETGEDPWSLGEGATDHLAELHRLLAGEAAPVRRALLEQVYAVLDQFGPVLVPGTVEYLTDEHDPDSAETVVYDVSRVLGAVDLNGTEPWVDLAALSWIDRSAQDCYNECAVTDDDEWEFDQAAFTAWKNLHHR